MTEPNEPGAVPGDVNPHSDLPVGNPSRFQHEIGTPLPDRQPGSVYGAPLQVDPQAPLEQQVAHRREAATEGHTQVGSGSLHSERLARFSTRDMPAHVAAAGAKVQDLALWIHDSFESSGVREDTLDALANVFHGVTFLAALEKQLAQDRAAAKREADAAEQERLAQDPEWVRREEERRLRAARGEA